MDENNYENTEVVESKSNTKAIAGFVCGLVGMLCCFPVGIVGLVFSILALKEINETGNEKNKGLAIAGIIVASIGIVWQLIALIAYGAIAATFVNDPEFFNQFVQ